MCVLVDFAVYAFVSAVLLERQYLLILTLRLNAQYVSGILTTCMDMHGATLVYIFCFLFSSYTIRNISKLAKDQTISSGHNACSKACSSTTGQKRIMRQHKNQTCSSCVSDINESDLLNMMFCVELLSRCSQCSDSCSSDIYLRLKHN